MKTIRKHTVPHIREPAHNIHIQLHIKETHNVTHMYRPITNQKYTYIYIY